MQDQENWMQVYVLDVVQLSIYCVFREEDWMQEYVLDEMQERNRTYLIYWGW